MSDPIEVRFKEHSNFIIKVEHKQCRNTWFYVDSEKISNSFKYLYDLIENLKSNGLMELAPIFITSNHKPDTVLSALMLVYNGFSDKPFNSELERLLSDWSVIDQSVIQSYNYHLMQNVEKTESLTDLEAILPTYKRFYLPLTNTTILEKYYSLDGIPKHPYLIELITNVAKKLHKICFKKQTRQINLDSLRQVITGVDCNFVIDDDLSKLGPPPPYKESVKHTIDLSEVSDSTEPALKKRG